MIVGGTVRVPGDKSITHRALLLGALARGTSHVGGALTSLDARSYRPGAATARRRDLAAPRRAARCPSPGGAGCAGPTTCSTAATPAPPTRLLLGLLAGHRFPATLTGDALAPPPADAAGHGAARADGRAVHGARRRRASAHRSGAARCVRCATRCRSRARRSRARCCSPGSPAASRSTLREPHGRSRDHTERHAARLRLSRWRRRDGWIRFAPDAAGSSRSSSQVPGDPSSAAFLVGAAVLAEGGELRIAGVGRQSDPDRVSRRARADGRRGRDRGRHASTSGSRWPTWSCGRRRFAATEVAAGEIPALIDEIPLLAVLASRARGHHGVPRGRRAAGEGERPARR